MRIHGTADFLKMKSDETLRLFFVFKKFSYDPINVADLLSVTFDGSVDPFKTQRKSAVCHQQFSKPQKNTHNRNIDLGRFFTIQNT